VGSGGKSGGQTIGYRYYMSLHMGLCCTGIDEIVQINVGDVRAWPVPDGDSEEIEGMKLVAEGPDGIGVALFEDGHLEDRPSGDINTFTTGDDFDIEAPELFGGDKKEGGIEGKVTVLRGQPTQVVPGFIKSLMGGLVPDFRGVATLFYDGLLCSMNPYPKKWSFRLRRVTSEWDGGLWQPDLAVIWMNQGSVKGMNPAHIIYECLTNRKWGRGYARSWIDDDAMTAVAQKLYDENFGLCMKWTRRDALGSFIQEVIDHIGGSLLIDRKTGLIKLSLLRDDYDLETIPSYTLTSGLLSVEEDETSSQEDIVNEVIVKWFDPLKQNDRELRIHNLASLQSLQGFKTETNEYMGIADARIASRVAQRDLRAVATMLKRYKLIFDRVAFDLAPGDPFIISVPEIDLYNVVLRTGDVEEASGTDGQIKVTAVLDVFGLPDSSFISEQPSTWVEPSRKALPATHRVVREAHYGEIVQFMTRAERLSLPVDAGFIVAFAEKPTVMHQGFKILASADGEVGSVRGTGTFSAYAELDGAIGKYDTVATFNNATSLGLVRINRPVQIGNEICAIVDIDTTDGVTGTLTLGRGCFDTVPQSHGDGDGIFFLATGGGTDAREYVAGEEVVVKLLTATSSSELKHTLAPGDTIDIVGRQGLPWPPADVQADGVLVGDLDATAHTFPIVLTWVGRNRLLIQDHLVDHFEPHVAEEAGTTYQISVFNGPGDTTPNRVATTASATFSYTNAMYVTDGIGSSVTFELEALRDGLASAQKYRFTVAV
jgi:hypothetical protein